MLESGIRVFLFAFFSFFLVCFGSLLSLDVPKLSLGRSNKKDKTEKADMLKKISPRRG